MENENGYTPLMLAVDRNDFERVQYIVGVDRTYVNYQDPRTGLNALMIAVDMGSLNIVKFLMQNADVDLSLCDKNGRNALGIAIFSGHFHLTKYLIENAQCNPHVVTKQIKNTLLGEALLGGNFSILQYLVEKGHLDPDQENADGETTLIAACKKSDIQVAEYLLSKPKINVDHVDKTGNTVFLVAAERGHLSIIQSLVSSKRVNINMQNPEGNTALMLAAYNGRLDLVEYLVKEAHADVTIQNQEGNTALMLAAYSGRLKVVEYLVERAHADVTVENQNHRTAIIRAAFGKSFFIVKYLFEHAKAKIALQVEDVLALHKASEDNSSFLKIFLFLIQHDENKALLLIQDLEQMKAIVHTLLKTFDGTDLTICMRGYPQIFFMFPLQPSYPFYSLMKCYLAALGSKTLTQLQSMHIHVVGEACAGKSETIRRLQEAQKQTIFSSFKTSSPTLISLEEGRTRGIESTILVSERQATNFVVHDYGGQEELKINHADSLHRDGSVYVIVLPMWNMLRKSAYSNDEISKQLLKWLRYLYSMYSKVESATHTDVTKQKATFDQKHGGIPVIIVLNKFSKYQRHVTDDHCDTLYRNLVLDVKRYFAVGEFGEHCLQASTFDFILMQTSSVAIDGIIASKVRKLQDSMEMLCTALVTTSQFSMPAIVSYVIEAYDRVKSFNMLESMETMEKEIKNMISHYSGFAALTEIDIKCLSEVFLAPCLDALVYKNKLILMKRKKHIGMSRESVETVVVTRPSMLTSRVVGEILFHFVGSERDEDKHSSASISHYILNDTELLHILTSRRSTTDAHDMNEMRNLFTTKHKDAATEIGLSISDLLIRMQLAVPYCKQTKMVVTEEKRDSVLLLGLFPGKMDKSLLPTYPSSSSSSSNSDDTPLTFLGNVLQTATQTKPYILSRVFCLPNNKYCFLPGYFMRLFLFVYDLYKHDAEIDFWKNGMQVRPRPSSSSSTAAKSQSTAIYIRAGKFQVGKEHSLHGFILHICDEEGQMNNNVLDQLYKIRTFLQTNMWGLQVREYCIVNEDYLQTQRYKLQHVDEVEQALLVHGKLSSEDYYSSGSTEEHRKLRNLSMYFGDIFPHLSIGDTFSVISKWKITVNAYRVEGDVVYLDIGHQHTADLKATIGSLESVLQQFLANQHVEIVMLRRYVLELLRLGKYPTMSLAEVDEMIQKMIPKDSTAVISDVARLLTNSSNAALLSRSIENELSIYNYPLIYMVEKVSNVASVNCPVGYCFKKLDLRYLLHDVYRVRFLCQHCGQYPKHDSGYEITVMPSKWKTFLTALHYSLCVTEFMLKVGGVPNGISQISKLALGSVDILDEKNQAFLQDTALQVNKLKESLEGLLEDYKIEEAEVKKPPTTLLKKTYSITGSHINEVAKLFQDVLGDTSVQKENTGLIYMTSNEDSGNKRAWVCKGENRCEKWFRETGKICVEYEYGYK